MESYISIDIETNGPIPMEYAMVSLGACSIMSPEVRFYRIIRPTTDEYVEKAIQTHGITIEEAKRTGMEPEKVMSEFADWVGQACGPDNRPVLVSFGEFDYMFLKFYLVKYGGYSALGGPNWFDMKSYAAGMLNCAWSETKKRELRRYGFRTVQKHTHNALEDALEQAEMFKLFLKYQEGRIDSNNKSVRAQAGKEEGEG